MFASAPISACCGGQELESKQPAVAIIATVNALGTSLNDKFTTVSTAIQ